MITIYFGGNPPTLKSVFLNPGHYVGNLPLHVGFIIRHLHFLRSIMLQCCNFIFCGWNHVSSTIFVCKIIFVPSPFFSGCEMPSILEFFEDKTYPRFPVIHHGYHPPTIPYPRNLPPFGQRNEPWFPSLGCFESMACLVRHIPPKKKTVVIHGILKWVSYGSLPSGGTTVNNRYVCIHIYIYMYTYGCPFPIMAIVFFFYIVDTYCTCYIYILHMNVFIGCSWMFSGFS